MKILRLGGGPTLTLYADWETEPVDVTDRAHQYLCELVSVQSSLKVGDIFRLLRACPPLIDIFARWHAKEFLEHAEKGGEAWSDDVPHNERIEYLELSSEWFADGKTGRIEYSHKMKLSGMSPVQQADDLELGVSAGNRINFDVSGAILNCLDLSLRVDHRINFYPRSSSAKKKSKLPKIAREHVTLGDILEGFLFGISWFGGPGDGQEVVEAMQEMRSDEANWTCYSSVEEFETYLKQLTRTANHPQDVSCKKIFKKRGGIETDILTQAIWQLDDEMNSQASLDVQFKGKVRLKKKYREFDGKSLRTAFAAKLQEAKLDPIN
jgi:hypothetical protein